MPVFTREMIRYMKLLEQGIDYNEWLKERERARRERRETREARLRDATAAAAEAARREQEARDAAAKEIAQNDLRQASQIVKEIEKEESADRKEEVEDKKIVAMAAQGGPGPGPGGPGGGSQAATPSAAGGVSAFGAMRMGSKAGGGGSGFAAAGGGGSQRMSATGGGGGGSQRLSATGAGSNAASLVAGGALSQVALASQIVAVQEGTPVEVLDEKGIRRLAFLRDLIKTEIDRIRRGRGPEMVAAKEDLTGRKYAVDWGAEIARGRRCKLYSCRHADFPKIQLGAKVYPFGGKDMATYVRANFSPDSLKIVRHLAKKHPTIIQTWDIFATSDRLIVIQEFAEKGNLKDVLDQNGPFDEVTGGRIARQVVKAVDQLGEIGISHRKIRPDHVLLKSDNSAKITGLYASVIYWDPERNEAIALNGQGDAVQQSRSVVNSARLSNAGGGSMIGPSMMGGSRLGSRMSAIGSPSAAAAGKPTYDAPEVYSGAPYDPIRADVWSLGATIYNLFSNQYPYDLTNNQGTTDGEIQFRVDQLNISSSGKELLKQMLTLDALNRIKINDVFNHPWIKRQSASLQ